MVTTVPALAHQLEYHRLRLAKNEDDGIAAWSFAFDHAWDDRLLDQCRQMLSGIKADSVNLSPTNRMKCEVYPQDQLHINLISRGCEYDVPR